MDSNGNNRQFKRLSSLSEISFEETGDGGHKDLSLTDISDKVDTTSPTPGLDPAVLNHLHSLIKNVQISDSLVDYINREVLGMEDANANFENRTRRKSCFTISSTLGNIAEHTGSRTRRQSVANKANSLPRRKLSGAGLNERFHQNSSVNSQRRSSVVHGNTGRRNSQVTAPRSRRSSVHHFDGHLASGQFGGRRNSVANSNMHRRSSLAHAYQNSAMPKLRRMSSVQNVLDNTPNCAYPQRRRSSIKAPCFPVTKIASVQKRLNKKYQRRKRNERAHVNITDVKSAFREIRKSENFGASDSGTNSDVNNDDNRDENCNVYVDFQDTDITVEDIDVAYVEDTVEKSVAGTTKAMQTFDDETFEAAPGEVPAPRRKLSIQVRAWELSRKLRQKRREKRKGFNESDLI